MAEIALGIAGLVIGGIPLTVQTIGNLGDAVLQRIKNYDDDYRTLLDLVVRINKSHTQDLFLFFHEQGREVPEQLQKELHLIFQALRNILEELLLLFPVASQPQSDGSKIKLSARDKSRADAVIQRLEDWNDRFFKRALVYVLFGRKVLPSSFDTPEDEIGILALKKVERLREAIDESLERTKQVGKLLLNHPDRPDARQPLPHSTLHLSRPVQDQPDDTSNNLVEYRSYSDDARPQEIQDQRRTVREVAAIMHQADPRLMGILYCKGFLLDSLANRFELHFPFPMGYCKPRSLLELLMDPQTRQSGVKHPLNHRIFLAKSIVSAVFVLHAADFVHKQIRPDNIIVFDAEPQERDDDAAASRSRYPYVLGKPFLVGFDSARKVDAASQMLHVDDWRKSLYLSPERHRLQRGDKFRMQHDLFSLGVVLIEIGCWETFQDKKGCKIGSIIWENPESLRAPEELKRRYIHLANSVVPRLMGQRYADVVLACLTGIDRGDDDISLHDDDGIVVGTAYITDIVRALEEISM